VTQAQKALQAARVLHAAFLLAAIGYVLVPAVAIKTQTRDLPPVFLLAISFVAAATLGAGIFLRRKIVAPAAEALCRNSEDAAAASRWRSGVIISLVFCETSALFGLAMRVAGVTWKICGLFYIAGFLLLLAWTPKLDLPSSNAE
jgi:F0F1-type ATP synthase membrane subunit c/vacuolar-type H+-ATPase subunit K